MAWQSLPDGKPQQNQRDFRGMALVPFDVRHARTILLDDAAV